MNCYARGRLLTPGEQLGSLLVRYRGTIVRVLIWLLRCYKLFGCALTVVTFPAWSPLRVKAVQRENDSGSVGGKLVLHSKFHSNGLIIPFAFFFFFFFLSSSSSCLTMTDHHHHHHHHHHRRPPSLSLLTSSLPAHPTISTSPSTTHRQSQSPFRYVHFNNTPLDMNEKFVDETPLSDFTDPKLRPSLTASFPLHQHPQLSSHRPPPPPSSSPSPSPSSSPFSHRSARPNSPSSRLTGRSSPCFLRQPPAPLLFPSHTRTHSGSSYTRPRALRLANLVRPWLPVILYAMTSIGFLIAIAFWKTEVFTGMHIPFIQFGHFEMGCSFPCPLHPALDDLSRWLRRDEDFGHAVLFCLIFLTTFRTFLPYTSSLR
jgi:hypothetical protein